LSSYTLKVYIINNKEEEIKRLESESKVINSLHNPYILRFLDMYTENGEFFMITEYCPNGSVAALVNAYKLMGKSLSENTVFEWTMQMFNALVHMHRSDIIHGDLSTENVFIGQNHQIKLGGIGLATSYGYYKRTSTVLTDYNYVPPEVAQKQSYYKNSDVWSAACIIYELMTLEKAFKGVVELDSFKSILNDKLPEVENSIFIGPLLNR
jgi:NIMA (never in mitosis gene a)-related kinase